MESRIWAVVWLTWLGEEDRQVVVVVRVVWIQLHWLPVVRFRFRCVSAFAEQHRKGCVCLGERGVDLNAFPERCNTSVLVILHAVGNSEQLKRTVCDEFTKHTILDNGTNFFGFTSQFVLIKFVFARYSRRLSRQKHHRRCLNKQIVFGAYRNAGFNNLAADLLSPGWVRNPLKEPFIKSRTSPI